MYLIIFIYQISVTGILKKVCTYVFHSNLIGNLLIKINENSQVPISSVAVVGGAEDNAELVSMVFAFQTCIVLMLS